MPDVFTNRKTDLPNQSKANNANETRKKTRDAATQTEEKYQEIASMECRMSELSEKVKTLQDQVDTLTEQNEKLARQISEHEHEQDFDEDDDESYKANTNEMVRYITNAANQIYNTLLSLLVNT